MKSQASFFEATKVAIDSLRGSKLRSFLTLLGIILSTTTLISVMAVIHGMDVVVATSASTMGTEGFRVVRFAFINNWDPKKFLEYQRKNPQLTLEEYDFLKGRTTLVKEMSPSAQRGVKVTSEGDLVDGVALISFNSSGAGLTNTEIETGRMFSDAEDNRHVEVVVLGADLKQRFFPNVDPIGKTVQVDGRPFQVIGVAKAKGSVFGQSQDNFISIPIQTYVKIYGARSGLQYNFSALSKERMTEAQDQIRVLLRASRHLRPDQDDTFMILSSDTLISAWNNLTGAIAAAAIGIVSVFMVVGGVVIMNIMLAVVSERTREIGVRKSVGARRQDILNQFLVESSALAGIGGLIGVTISWLVALIVRNTTLVPMETPLNGVIIGVALSVAVRLFFGIYPARRASRLDPIVALRSEN
ncbi:MAG TPA: ABC transporter permease [Bryobacteraceae bacterium]|nr:ABC transporter permease [Bryobacteraceae bacterium]